MVYRVLIPFYLVHQMGLSFNSFSMGPFGVPGRKELTPYTPSVTIKCMSQIIQSVLFSFTTIDFIAISDSIVEREPRGTETHN
jgi:hypothetical protein